MSAWDLLESWDQVVPANPQAVLEELGLQVLRTVSRRDSTELLARCPAHAARTGRLDRHPSFWLNSASGAFICFSCQYTGTIVQLAQDTLGLSRPDAVRWIVRHGVLKRTDDVTPQPEPVRVSEAALALYTQPPPEALAERRLTAEACTVHGVLWDPATRHWILPIRDAQGVLQGWQEKGKRFFHNHPTGVQKSLYLFGGHLPLADSAVLVESPLDAVRLTSMYIPGAVAAYGAQVSDAQMRLLRARVRILTLGLDNDDAGRAATRSLYDRWRPRGVQMRVLDYRHTGAKDIGDMSDGEIHRALENAHRPFLRGR